MKRWRGPGFATYLGTGELEAASPNVASWWTPADCAHLTEFIRGLEPSLEAPCRLTLRDASVRIVALESEGPSRFLAIFEPSPRGPSPLEPLSARHQQIAGLAALGMTTREISEEMDRSPNTIKAQLRHIYDVLGVSNRAELARLVASYGGDP